MLSGLAHSEIRSWRGSQCFSEHGYEGAGGAVARFQGGVRDLCPLRQKAHRLHQPKLLPPFTKGHAQVFLEKSLHRSPASPSYFAYLRERPAVAWVS